MSSPLTRPLDWVDLVRVGLGACDWIRSRCLGRDAPRARLCPEPRTAVGLSVAFAGGPRVWTRPVSC